MDVFALDKIQFRKWPLRNGGATYLREVTDTVQTVQYSDSQCIQYWHKRRRCSWLHAGLYCIAPRPFWPQGQAKLAICAFDQSSHLAEIPVQ